MRDLRNGGGGPAEDDLAAYRAVRETDHPLHVGALCILDGPVDLARLDRTIAERAGRSARLSRSLEAATRGWLGGVKDERRPVRSIARAERESVQPPGGDAELAVALAEIWSRPLPKSGAPFRVSVVEGLARGRTAIVVKAHRSVTDDRGGAELVDLLVGDDPPSAREPIAPRRTVMRSERALPAPAGGGLLALSRPLLVGTRLVSRAVAELAEPSAALEHARDAARWIESTSLILSTPAPEVPINGTLGRTRALGVARFARDVLRGIEEALDAGREEVVLAIVADALGRYLKARGRVTIALELVALAAPGSPHDQEPGDRGTLATLPVGALGTRARLAAVRTALSDPVARSRCASLQTVVGLGLALPTGARQVTATLAYQAVNTVCVRARPARRTVAIAGRRVLLLAPLASLPWTIGLAFAWADSGQDEVAIGVHADSGLIPDIGPVLEALRSAYVEAAASAGVPAIDPERRAGPSHPA